LEKSSAAFPASFVWGAATSGAQGEGMAESSDWRLWEKQNRAPLSGKASDKRSRYEEDFLWMAELGLTQYRTSLEWSRIEPQKGVYDRAALEDYRLMMESAKRRGITLWITLQHLTLPAWFAKMGGFMDDAALMYWHRFAELVAKELGRHADYWIPVHDPVYYALNAYLLGLLPPGKQRMDKFSEMLVRIHRAQGDAHWLLKKYVPIAAKVGATVRVMPVHPLDPDSDADRTAAEFVDNYVNQIALDALREGAVMVPGKGSVEIPSCRKAADFLGLDYFHRLVVSKKPRPECRHNPAVLSRMEGMPGIGLAREGDVITEHGYGSFPEGIYEAIKKIHLANLELPVYITACGTATSDEEYRVECLRRSLASTLLVLDQGLDVRGYFHWSDVDT